MKERHIPSFIRYELPVVSAGKPKPKPKPITTLALGEESGGS
jgi:hypothetical protein